MEKVTNENRDISHTELDKYIEKRDPTLVCRWQC
jgi:hypothetical protein